MRKGQKLSEEHIQKLAEGRARAKAEREASAERPRRRKKLGTLNLKLDVSKSDLDPNYHYRWANDEKNRLQQLTQDNDYDFVESNDIRSDQKGKIARRVGTHEDGSPKNAYLMRIPTDFYKENLEEREERNRQIDRAIKRGDSQMDGQDRQHVYDAGIQYNPGGSDG